VRLPNSVKRAPTYDPSKFFTDDMKKMKLRGDEIRQFEKDMEAFKKDNTIIADPIPVIKT
jgi:hypothetical protein